MPRLSSTLARGAKIWLTTGGTRRKLRGQEAKLLGSRPDSYMPYAISRASRRFAWHCTLHPFFTWRDRRRLSLTLRGYCALFVASGRYDAAAKLLSNPILLAMVQPGDVRWQAILKPLIDNASRYHLLPMLFQMWVTSRWHILARALVRRARRRFQSNQPSLAMARPHELLDSTNSHTLPLVYEGEATFLLGMPEESLLLGDLGEHADHSEAALNER